MFIRFDRHLFLHAGAAALLLFAGPGDAFAQNRDTNARLSRIENEIQTLSRAIFKGETPPPGAFDSGNPDAARIESRLTQMEMDIQNLTGKLEEQSYELTRMKEENARILMQLENRINSNAQAAAANTYVYDGPGSSGQMMSNIPPQPSVPRYEDGGSDITAAGTSNGMDYIPPGSASVGNPPQPGTGQLGSMAVTMDQSGNIIGTAKDSPTAAYESAFTMLRNQDYAGAQSAFDTFIKQNPDHQLVPNAMYWLGETYYVRNDFDRAVRIFAEAYQKYPKGAKAPDNLLKLGMSLAGQGKTKDACIALGQLKKEYPAGAAPVLSRGEQEMTRLNCATM